ncbi:MAG: c-type cytochrome [Rhizobiales bacterium]|nr:c-type cytochrome [Hyphomicrobiales bacterium]
MTSPPLQFSVRLMGLLLMCLAPVVAGLPAGAQTAEQQLEADVGEVFVLSIGGKLYDNLFTMTGQEVPKTANPNFPDYVSSKSLGTWRCVSCHGWDYSGADGERGGTGKSLAFRSLRKMVGLDPKIVVTKFRSAPHGYDAEVLPDYVVDILALFLSVGQYDRDLLLDDKGASKGNAEAGQPIFEGACSNCHQLDGRAYLRGERGDKSSLGWLARNRPEQVLHKIMNGFPGTDMLAMRFMPDQQIADLMAYMQTLDAKQK